jgi:hypothetical protein
MFEYSGLELIYVEKIYWNKSAGRGSDSYELCVDFTRVLSTKDARDQCKGEKDLATDINLESSSIVRTRRLGGKSLEAALETQAKSESRRLTFHRGDFVHTTAACNIVGFVGWSHVPDDQLVSNVRDKELATSLLPQIKRTHPEVKSINDIDWVYCGGDFSDQDNG